MRSLLAHSLVVFIGLTAVLDRAGVFAQETPANPATQTDTDSGEVETQCEYTATPSPLFYQIKLKADYGASSEKLDLEGILVYELTQTDGDTLSIECECQWKRNSNYRGVYRDRVFRLLSRLPSGRAAACEIDSKGKPIQVSRPAWIFGLPIDLGRIAFPQLSADDQWKITQPVSLVQSIHVYNQLQLIEVSPEIKDPFRSHRAVSRADTTSEKIALAVMQRQWIDKDDPVPTFRESYSIDGSGLNPQIEVTGDREVAFARERGSVDSLKLSLRIVWKEPNHEITVPCSLELQRLPEEEIVAYKQAKEKSAKEQEKRLAEHAAMQQTVPDVTERDRVITTLKTADQSVFDLMVSKLYGEKVADDPEMARVLYDQFFERDRLPYHTVNVIKNLDPSLEKAATIASKYAASYSSFDISLTGDLIDEDTPLKRNQIVCYPDSSRYKAARFYGAVDEVLVLETRDRDPKLIAIKRAVCRLPAPAMIDPNAATSE
ncbi:hypothetical protein [Novipirellula caenicola]|uniref:SLA1 homology domain-containing protein n=1 Tax=Novipirellula caenicola TaxID=1536901 RepID=A0ABP9VKH5_9BACT